MYQPRAGSARPQSEEHGRGSNGRWMMRLLYPHAMNLETYLEHWLREMTTRRPGSTASRAIREAGGPIPYLVKEHDNNDFKQMLRETLVAYQAPPRSSDGGDEHAPLPRHASLNHRSSMEDLLDRVITTLLRSSSSGQGGVVMGHHPTNTGEDPRRNVLSLGYRVTGPQATSELLTVQGVACTFPNTTANVIRSSPWELLLSRIGDDLMFSLLRQHTLLLRLPNRCYMQLAGRPVPDLCRHLGLTTGPAAALAPSHGKDVSKRTGSTWPSTDGGSDRTDTRKRKRNRVNEAMPVRVSHEDRFSVSGPDGSRGVRQVAGAALNDAPASRAPSSDANPHPKATSPLRAGRRSAVLLPRQRIFYSNTFVGKAGFPRGHPLNPERERVHGRRRLPRGDGVVNGDDESIAARNLVRDVFCRRKIANESRPGSNATAAARESAAGHEGMTPAAVAASVAGTATYRIAPSHMKQESAVTRVQSAGRLPKRLRTVTPVFEEIIARVRRCNFGRLLEAYCPLPAGIRRSRSPGTKPEVLSARSEELERSHDGAWTTRGASRSLIQNEVIRESAESAAGLSRAPEPKGEDTYLKLSEGEDGSIVSPEQAICNVSAVESGGLGQFPLMASNSCDDHCADRASSRQGCGMELEHEASSPRLVHGVQESIPEDSGGESDCSMMTSATELDHSSEKTLLEVEADTEDRRDPLGEDVGVHEADYRENGMANAADIGKSADNAPGYPCSLDFHALEMATGHRQVTDLLCQVCHRIFPTTLWGSKRNMVCLMRAVERFVTLGRHENMSVAEVTTGMRTSDFDWMSLDWGNNAVDHDAQTPAGSHEHRNSLTPKKPEDRKGGFLRGEERGPAVDTGEGPTADGRRALTGPVGKDIGDASSRPGGPSVAMKAPKTFSTEGDTRRTGGQPRGKRCRRHEPRRHAGSEGHAVPDALPPTTSDQTSDVGRTGTNRNGDNPTNEDGRGKGKGKNRIKNKGRSQSRCQGQDQDRGRGRRHIRGEGKGKGKKKDRCMARRRCPPSELAKRAELLEALVYWTFKDVVVPLLRSLFYITEGETGSQQVFYIRKPVWAKFRRSSIEHLTKHQYQRVDVRETFPPVDGQKGQGTCQGPAVCQYPGTTATGPPSPPRKHASLGRTRTWSFPVASVRLVPKPHGVRAITNLSRRVRLERERVHWFKGVPLPVPRGTRLLQRHAGGKVKEVQEALRYSVAETSGGIIGGGGGGGGGSRGSGVSGTASGGGSVLLPSTNMQLSNVFQVLKHEYRANPCLVGAAVFGLDDVFARIKAFVVEILRRLPSISASVRSKTPTTARTRTAKSPAQSAHGVPDSDSCAQGTASETTGAGSVAYAEHGGDHDHDSRDSGHPQKCSLGTSWLHSGGRQGQVPGEETARKAGCGGARALPQLFFASVDIKHCYDTVDQAKLMEIVRRLVRSQDYVVQKYSKTHPYKAMDRVQVSNVKEAVAMEDISQFKRLAQDVADRSVDTIFTDQVVFGTISRDEVLDMIEDHITHNIVRVPGAAGHGEDAFFRRGSVLSGLLCNFFFGHVEASLLGDILGSNLPPPVPRDTLSPSARKQNVLDHERCGTHHDEGTTAGNEAPCFEETTRTELGETPIHGTRGGGSRARDPGQESPGSPGENCTPTKSCCGCRVGPCRYRRTETVRGQEPGDGQSCGTSPARPSRDYALLRQVDDFLLVTMNKAKAEAFVRVMHNESKTGLWGFSVHEGKTMVNFDMTIEGAAGENPRKVRRVRGVMFPWCGIRFDTQTCEVMANYTRFEKCSVAESVSVHAKRAGACLINKMKCFMSPKCHALMLDEGPLGLNSRQKVLLNVYEMVLVCAAKTGAYALRLPLGPVGNPSLLSHGALETTAYAYSLIQSRSNLRKGTFGTSSGVRCVCKISRFEVTWLGLHAFWKVFDALAARHRCFARPAADVKRALLETETRNSLLQRGHEHPKKTVDGSAPGTKIILPRRSRSPARLRAVVHERDAVDLLETLTSGSW